MNSYSGFNKRSENVRRNTNKQDFFFFSTWLPFEATHSQANLNLDDTEPKEKKKKIERIAVMLNPALTSLQ